MNVCKDCRTTEASRWYKKDTQCSSCYRKERNSKIDGHCKTCGTTKTHKWAKGGTQCNRCYVREYNSKIDGPCKTCGTTKSSQWHKKSKQCRSCYRREYNSKINGHCKTCGTIKSNQWAKGGTQCQACYNRLRKYNITSEELQSIPAHCQICGAEDNLHIDHCHDSGKVRGRLCQSCNHGLGMFTDDAEKLKAAIKYLEIV